MNFHKSKPTYIYVPLNFSHYPSRYPNFLASTRPVPSWSQKPLPVGPCLWLLTSIKHIKRINLAKCLLIMQTSYMRIITSIAYKESRYGYGWSLDESWFPGHKISLSMLWSICAISVPLYTSMVAYKSSVVANGWDNNNSNSRIPCPSPPCQM